MPKLNILGIPGGSESKEPACNAEDLGSNPGLERSPGGGHGNPTPVLPREFHGLRSPAGHGVTELDTAEQPSTAHRQLDIIQTFIFLTANRGKAYYMTMHAMPAVKIHSHSRESAVHWKNPCENVTRCYLKRVR